MFTFRHLSTRAVLVAALALVLIGCIAWATYSHCVHASASQATTDTLEAFVSGNRQYPAAGGRFESSQKQLSGEGGTPLLWKPPTKTADGDRCIAYSDQLMTNFERVASDPSRQLAKLLPTKTTKVPHRHVIRLLLSTDTMDKATLSSGKRRAGRSHTTLTCKFDVTLNYVYKTAPDQPTQSRSVIMKNQTVQYTPGNSKGTKVPAPVDIKVCFPDLASASLATITFLKLDRVDTNGGLLVVDRVFVLKLAQPGNRVLHEATWPVEKVGFVSGFADNVVFDGQSHIPAVRAATGRFTYTYGNNSHSADTASLIHGHSTHQRRLAVTFNRIGGKGERTIDGEGLSGVDVTLCFSMVSYTYKEAFSAFREWAEEKKPLPDGPVGERIRQSVTCVTLKNVKPHQPYEFTIAMASTHGATVPSSYVFGFSDRPIQLAEWSEVDTSVARSRTAQVRKSPQLVRYGNLFGGPGSVMRANQMFVIIRDFADTVREATISPFEEGQIDIILPIGYTTRVDRLYHLSSSGQVAELTHDPRDTTDSKGGSKAVTLSRTFDPKGRRMPQGFDLTVCVHLPHTFALVNTDALQHIVRFSDNTRVLLTIGQDRAVRVAVQASPNGPQTSVYLQQKRNISTAPDIECRVIFFQESFTVLVNREVVHKGALPSQLDGIMYTKRSIGTPSHLSGTPDKAYAPVSCTTMVCDPRVLASASLLSDITCNPSDQQLMSVFSGHHVTTLMPRVAYQYKNAIAAQVTKEIMSGSPNPWEVLLQLFAELHEELVPTTAHETVQIGNSMSPHGGITMTLMLNMLFLQMMFSVEQNSEAVSPSSVFTETRKSSPARYRVVAELDTVRIAVQQRLPKNPLGQVTDYFAYDLVVFFPSECGKFDTEPLVLASDNTLLGNRDGFFMLTYSSDGTNDRVCLLTHQATVPIKMVSSLNHAMNRKPITTSGKSLFQTFTYDKMWAFALVVMNRLTPTFCNPYDSENKCTCSSTVTSSPIMGVTNFPSPPSYELISGMRIPNTTCNSSNTTLVKSADECKMKLFTSADTQCKGVSMVSYNESTKECTMCVGDKPKLSKKQGSVTFWNSMVLGDQVLSRLLSQ